MSSEPGDLPSTFGKYLLTERLATGGMAEIYLAKLVGPGGFEKQLVIKQIHAELSGQRQFVDLFVAEAKTLVSLAHGNIVPVYELGVVGDTYFIAMEYIDGPTLYRLTERANQRDERLDPSTAAWIAARILEGLDYAHRKGDGVIHRDLSPRNVMLSRDGEVKLVDFGIALSFGAETGDATSTAPPTGSFPYMSPEQVRRETLSPQTDLFSTGVLLWEMLVGQRLFARDDLEATLAAVTGAPIDRPSARVPGIADALDAIVVRALERDVSKRWETAADMLAPLQKYLYTLAEAPPGPRDVAALVARFCPPETRRMPTNLPEHSSEPPAPDGGPRTAVIPRAPAKSFATHVVIDELLDSSPPSTDANRSDEEVEDDDGRATKPVRAINDDDLPARTDRPPDGYVSTLKFSVPGRQAPTRAGLVIAGIGAFGLSIGAVVVFVRGRDAVLAQGDAGVRDARPVDARAADATLDAPIDAPVDAPAPVDGPTRDTQLAASPRDARVDAALATGMLKIGADPWGEIAVDGLPHGRTPATLTVPVGHHVVVVTFSGDGAPQEKTFPVEVVANETVPIQAKFSN